MAISTQSSAGGSRLNGAAVAKARTLDPAVERAIRDFHDDYADTLEKPQRDLAEALLDGQMTLDDYQAVRSEVEAIFGEYTADIRQTFVQGNQNGAEVGRRITGTRHNLDIDFDVVPERAIEELNSWAFAASGDVMARLEGDIAGFLRGAQTEGWGIPEISKRLNEDLFNGRLKAWEARRIARTETVASSTRGTHSALVDAESVVGEQWLATFDGRERDSHAEAHGQVVDPNTNFIVGGQSAAHPGAMSLSADERIHCRCTIVPVFADELTADQLDTVRAGGRIWI